MSTTHTGDGTGPFGGAYTIPSDGDGNPVKAADVNVALVGLANDLAFVRERGIIGVYEYAVEGATLETFSTASYVEATNAHVDIADTLAGDVILFDVFFMANYAGAGGQYGKLRVKFVDDHGGTPTIHSNTGAYVWIAAPGGPCTLTGAETVTEPGTTRVAIQGLTTNVGDDLTLPVAIRIRCQHLRKTAA